MAITSAALQTALGSNLGDPLVLMAFEPSQGTLQQWLVHGKGTVPGRVRLVTTTASDNAATQAAAVLTALRLG
mgnify:CR=1 FL=1